MIAVHLGETDEDKINNMSFLFFEDVLEQLGHKLSYDAICNYAGNSFMEKSWDMIVDANPMLMGDGKHGSKRSQKSMADFFSNARVLPKGSKDIPRAPVKGKAKGK